MPWSHSWLIQMEEHCTRIPNLALTQKSRKSPIWLLSKTLQSGRHKATQKQNISRKRLLFPVWRCRKNHWAYLVEIVGVETVLSLCEVQVFSTEGLSPKTICSKEAPVDEVDIFDDSCYIFTEGEVSGYEEADRRCQRESPGPVTNTMSFPLIFHIWSFFVVLEATY